MERANYLTKKRVNLLWIWLVTRLNFKPLVFAISRGDTLTLFCLLHSKFLQNCDRFFLLANWNRWKRLQTIIENTRTDYRIVKMWNMLLHFLVESSIVLTKYHCIGVTFLWNLKERDLCLLVRSAIHERMVIQDRTDSYIPDSGLLVCNKIA